MHRISVTVFNYEYWSYLCNDRTCACTVACTQRVFSVDMHNLHVLSVWRCIQSDTIFPASDDRNYAGPGTLRRAHTVNIMSSQNATLWNRPLSYTVHTHVEASLYCISVLLYYWEHYVRLWLSEAYTQWGSQGAYLKLCQPTCSSIPQFYQYNANANAIQGHSHFNLIIKFKHFGITNLESPIAQKL